MNKVIWAVLANKPGSDYINLVCLVPDKTKDEAKEDAIKCCLRHDGEVARSFNYGFIDMQSDNENIKRSLLNYFNEVGVPKENQHRMLEWFQRVGNKLATRINQLGKEGRLGELFEDSAMN